MARRDTLTTNSLFDQDEPAGLPRPPGDAPLAEIAKHRKAASEMVDRVGLDDGPAS